MKQTKDEINNPKSDRVKKYFAETTKQIILAEGVESVSVRKVASLAGYSFATIYNHFKSLDELLWYTRDLMILDLVAYIKEHNAEKITDSGGIKKLFRSYLDYFYKTPNIFRFFYFHHLKKEDKAKLSPGEAPQFENQYAETFEFLFNSGRYTPVEILIISKTLIYSTYGLLTLNLSDYETVRIEDVYQDLDLLIENLLNRI